MDYRAKLQELHDQLEVAQRTIAELEAAKKLLGPQRATILALCKKHAVDPTHEAVQARITELQGSLEALIKQVETELKP